MVLVHDFNQMPHHVINRKQRLIHQSSVKKYDRTRVKGTVKCNLCKSALLYSGLLSHLQPVPRD